MIRKHLEELVDKCEKAIDCDYEKAKRKNVDQALHSILQEIEAGLPKRKRCKGLVCNCQYNQALAEVREKLKNENS